MGQARVGRAPPVSFACAPPAGCRLFPGDLGQGNVMVPIDRRSPSLASPPTHEDHSDRLPDPADRKRRGQDRLEPGRRDRARAHSIDAAADSRCLFTRTFCDNNVRTSGTMEPIVVENALAPTDAGFSIGADTIDRPSSVDRSAPSTSGTPEGVAAIAPCCGLRFARRCKP